MLSIASIDLGSYGKPPPGCSTALVSFAVSLGGHNKRTRPATTGDDLIDRCPRPNFDLFVKGRINSRRHVVILYRRPTRSEEHTSELQSRENLVCRLLLE